MALHVLTYNMRRVFAIVGKPVLIKVIAEILSWFGVIVAPGPAIQGSQRPLVAN
jgi:hypothetical protein